MTRQEEIELLERDLKTMEDRYRYLNVRSDGRDKLEDRITKTRKRLRYLYAKVGRGA